MWEDFDETGDIETKSEVFASGRGLLPTLSGINLFSIRALTFPIQSALPEETAMASPEAVSLQANAEHPRDLPNRPSLLLDL